MVKSYSEAAVKQANFENRNSRDEDACRHCNENPCICDREADRL